MTKEERELWLTLVIGHEAFSVWQWISTWPWDDAHEPSKQEVLETLGLDSDKPIKRLKAFSLVVETDAPYDIDAKMDVPHYTLESFCLGITNGDFGTREYRKKPWYKIFDKEFKDFAWSVSGDPVTSVTLAIINKKPAVIVNDRNVLIGQNQYTSILDKEVDLIYRYEVGKKHESVVNQLVLEEVVHVPQAKQVISIEDVPVENWNVKHMAYYVCRVYEKAYSVKPPYTAEKLAKSNLKSSIDTLWLKCPQELRKTSKQETYKHFVGWVIGHMFYRATMKTLTSFQAMDAYIVDITKMNANKKLDPFDLS